MVETQVFRTVVATSKIAGARLGLFAGEFIPAGSHIGEYCWKKLQLGREEHQVSTVDSTSPRVGRSLPSTNISSKDSLVGVFFPKVYFQKKNLRPLDL